MYIVSSKDEPMINLSSFKQYVTNNPAKAGGAWYLLMAEAEAIKSMDEKLSKALADRHNNKIILRPKQMRLF
jgi:hypothetical protein